MEDILFEIMGYTGGRGWMDKLEPGLEQKAESHENMVC